MNTPITRLLKSATLGLTLTLAAMAPSVSMAATAAGEVLLLTGQGTATDPATGTIRALAKGQQVFAGEIVNSGANSYLNLKFTDGSFILLRPNTRFMIEHYADHHSAPVAPTAPAPATPVASAPATTVAAPTPPPAASASAESSTASRAFFRLMRGGFRAVSGLIGKADPNEYRIATPVATIGIRGTDYIVAICDAACARDPVLRAELPDGAGMQGGIVASVVDGRINVNSGGATLNTFPTGGSPFGWLGFSAQGATGGADTGTDVDAGQTAAVTGNGDIYILDQPPQFLGVQSTPDPTALCQ